MRDYSWSLALVLSAIVCCVASLLFGSAAIARVYRGINVAGAEFGQALPGTIGRDYIYPTAAEIGGYRRHGFDLVRIPVRWERLQGRPSGALRSTDMAALDVAVAAAGRAGMITVIDLHNYARWSSGASIADARPIGEGPVTAADLIDFWVRIGHRYPAKNVWLGLMNEPHDIAPKEWWRIASAVVIGLRKAGIHHRLLVPGTAWTGAHSWVAAGNALEAGRLTDPEGNMAFEVHQYLDAGSRGASGDCEPGSHARVEPALAWAKAAKARLFVGEIAAGGSAVCRSEYRAMIERLETSGVVDGWAAWGGGRWFNQADPFAISPQAETGHLQRLRPFIGGERRD